MAPVNACSTLTNVTVGPSNITILNDTLLQCYGRSFNYQNLRQITMAIYNLWPSDPRLVQIPAPPHWNITSLSDNIALTLDAAQVFTGLQSTHYPAGDVWTRIMVWKVPLLTLLLTSLPPVCVGLQVFVFSRFLGNPIGALSDLLVTLETARETAAFWEEDRALERLIERTKYDTEETVCRMWKALALIDGTWTEVNGSFELRDWLKHYLSECSRNPDVHNREKFIEAILTCGEAFARDRSTSSIPIIWAFVVFCCGAVTAVTQMSSSTTYINIEAHSVGISALFFWAVPVSALAAFIGASHAKDSQKNFKELQEKLNGKTYIVHKDPKTLVVVQCFIDFPESPQQNLPNRRKLENGGISVYQPIGRLNKLRQAFKSPLFFVTFIITAFGSIVTSLVISHLVPPGGWNQRLFAESGIYVLWLMSYVADFALRSNFMYVFCKDACVALINISAVLAIQVGIFNRPSAFALSGNSPVEIPGIPVVDAILHKRLWLYGSLMFLSILLQSVMTLVLVLIRYKSAVRVFLQAEDGSSNAVTKSTLRSLWRID